MVVLEAENRGGLLVFIESSSAHVFGAAMQCIAIHKLRVFDVAHFEDRGRKLNTLLSLEIDGVRVYSLSLAMVVTPSSCENTIGMFKSDEGDSVTRLPGRHIHCWHRNGHYP